MDGDAAEEEHLDHLRLGGGEKIAQRLHVHAVGGNLENLHRHSLLSLRLSAALSGARRLATATTRHLVGPGGVAEVAARSAAALRLVAPSLVPATRHGVGTKVLLPATAAASGGGTAVVDVLEGSATATAAGGTSTAAATAERTRAAATPATASESAVAASAATAASAAPTAAALVVARGLHGAHELAVLVAHEAGLALRLGAHDERGRSRRGVEVGRFAGRAETESARGEDRGAARGEADGRIGGRACGPSRARAELSGGEAHGASAAAETVISATSALSSFLFSTPRRRLEKGWESVRANAREMALSLRWWFA